MASPPSAPNTSTTGNSYDPLDGDGIDAAEAAKWTKFLRRQDQFLRVRHGIWLSHVQEPDGSDRLQRCFRPGQRFAIPVAKIDDLPPILRDSVVNSSSGSLITGSVGSWWRWAVMVAT